MWQNAILTARDRRRWADGWSRGQEVDLLQIFRYAVQEQLNSKCDQNHAHQAFDGDKPSFGQESKQERRCKKHDERRQPGQPRSEEQVHRSPWLGGGEQQKDGEQRGACNEGNGERDEQWLAIDLLFSLQVSRWEDHSQSD